MYQILSFGALYFICRKLREAGVSKIFLNIFLLANVIFFIVATVARFDFALAEYDIFPLHVTELIRAVNMNWVIITLYTFAAFFVMSLVTWFRPFTKRRALTALAISALITSYSIWEAQNIQPRYITIPTSKLQQGTDRIRIAFLVDVHIGGISTLSHLERAMKIADDSKPDILLLGGDILDGDMSYRTRELERLKESAKKARYGAFAVNGNHEHYLILDVDVEGIIRECGYDLLINERRETAGITLIGLEDMPYGWLRPYIKPEDKEKFVLVLKHRPGIPKDADGRFDLQLSGHTHGGQFWPLGYFKDRALNSTQGLTHQHGGYVYVSNGAGFNCAAMRLFVPPEVTIIDIVREN